VKILVADPAKNITVFVLERVYDPDERAALTRAILADREIRAEQVGFVIPPVKSSSTGEPHTSGPAGPDFSLPRLEMAGGEFCGNAARSFGLYAAELLGLGRKVNFFVSVSGASEPVQVDIDLDNNRAKAEMPKPLVVDMLDYNGCSLPVLVFEGITHIIAPDLEPERDVFFSVKSLYEKKFFAPAENSAYALGVMFYDTESMFMRPSVYVRSTDTLVFESSCGSGSAALGIWLGMGIKDGSAEYAIDQPGGVIETEMIKADGKIVRVTIGGEVKMGQPRNFTW